MVRAQSKVRREVVSRRMQYTVSDLRVETNWSTRFHVPPLDFPDGTRCIIATIYFSPTALEMPDGTITIQEELPWFYIALSTIPGARWGLFSAQQHAPNQPIGYYHGREVHSRENDYTMQLAAGRLRDGENNCSGTCYINTARGSAFQNNARFTNTGTIYSRAWLMPFDEVLMPYGSSFHL